MLYNKTLSRIYDTSFFLTEYFNRDIVSKFFAPNFENTEFMSSCFYEVLQNISPIPKFLSPLFYCEQDASTPFSSFLMKNSAKNYMFTIDERVELVKKVTTRFDNVDVDTTNLLLAEYAKKYEGAVVVKGLRAVSDFEYEFQIALINKKMNPELDTLFLTSSEKYTFLSSTVVKEMAAYGADLSEFAPKEIIGDIIEKTNARRQTQA